MKRLLCIALALMLSLLALTSCDALGNLFPNDGDGNKESAFDPENITFASAYEEAQRLGFEGTLDEFIAMISGKDGADGKDGVGISDVFIDNNGNLIVLFTNGSSKNCGEIAGADGKDGVDGAPGKDGETPYIGSNGNWWIGDTDTGVKAEGKDGVDGADGDDGKTPYIGTNGNWWIGTTDTGVKAGAVVHHNFGAWIDYSGNANVYCENRLFYRICSECYSIEWKSGSYDDHTFETVTTHPTCTAGGYDTKTCTTCGLADITNYTDSIDHLYSDKYSKNAYAHWFECIYCDAKKDEENHTLSDEGICSKCSYSYAPTEGISYKISDDGTYAEVVGYIGNAECVVIAATYKDLPVTRIGTHAFYGDETFKRVIIPDSVTDIGDWSFLDCGGLETFEIPHSVTSIGHAAIAACPKLMSITVDDDNTAYASIDGNLYSKDGKTFVLYADGRKESSFIIPDGVEIISPGAFYHSSGLVSVVIPDGVTSIGDHAFASCSDLVNVTIGSVTSISDDAFYNCDKLVEVINRSSLNIVKGSPDYGYLGYYAIEIHNGESKIDYYNDYLFYTSEGVNYLLGYIGDDTELVLPQSYNGENYVIYEYAFNQLYSITSVVIPDGVTSIGEYTFAYCYSLASVVIGDSVTSIGEYAFYNCDKLVEVINRSSLNIVKGSPDYGYLGYYAIEIHNGESKIDYYNDYLFYTSDGVNYLFGYIGDDTELVLPQSYNGENYVIYKYTFNRLYNITSVVIPNGVTSIGERAFYYCSSLSNVVIGDSVTSIGDSAFSSCDSLTSVVIPDSVTSIGDAAFYHCDSLTSVVIGDSVTSIGDNAFYNCRSLTSVVIGDSVTSIGSSAFYSCSSLSNVVISDSVTSIGEGAFYGIDSIYYEGSAEKFMQIAPQSTGANKIYYYAEKQPADGDRYWHYVDGAPTVWDACTHPAYDVESGCPNCGVVCNDHIDKNPTDGSCDICGADIPRQPTGDNIGDNGEELPPVTWLKAADLIFQMTDNSNYDELSSGCRRFLSGESDSNGFVEQNARDRNLDAYNYANVNITYLYYPNTSAYGWGASISRMNLAATSDTENGRPDMFCNFIYDMVSASLLGSFNNLYTDALTSEGVKTGEKTNYFQFAKDGKYDTNYKDTGDGYMIEYMQSLSLSENKMYLVASDYFTDLARSFMVVPVNIGLLESAIKPSSDANAYNYDADQDGAYEISDFYSLVIAGKWNYDNVKAFSEAVYQAPTDNADVLKDGRYGFALAAGGLGASGLLYTTSVTVIKRQVVEKIDDSDPDNLVTYQDYTFYYPAESAPLEDFVENLDSLFSSVGVVAINKSADRDGPINTTSQHSAEVVVRNAFAEGKVLFGGIVCVGSLEDTVYGGMIEEGEGFGVVPVPLYRTNYVNENGETRVDKYLTSIHNTGKVGAIGVRTKYFAQCSAFLNYQSLNSADILDDYYNLIMKSDSSVYSDGGVEMLNYIRENVRSGFDKAFEDAIARQAQMSGNKDLVNHKWHNMILDKCFNLTGDEMHEQYATWIDAKAEALQDLELAYENLPA